jgi:predicted alternative tryptophan synthase beta-subunit
MADKREKKNRRLKITPHLQLFKEGIKFMEPVVTVGGKRMHHFTPQTKQNQLKWKGPISSTAGNCKCASLLEKL